MMALKQAPYYWFECDKCGVSSGEDSDYSAWSDHGHAHDQIVNDDWWISADETNHYCWSCAPKCDECKATLDNDGGCEDCDKPADPGLIPGQTAISGDAQ
ncbi:hypothetical protein [Arthrobacter sp. B1805]|uniref:hypothetical protein n=1 Tax=Arthrobacter sp. B1805 TaxID=2058892 RepID=UPI000CE4806C|nr:hypothetical protein [Arthrobacter sp. B1805]